MIEEMESDHVLDVVAGRRQYRHYGKGAPSCRGKGNPLPEPRAR
jgi:hypothetical protein